MTRLADVIFSLLLLIVCSPFFLIIAIWIKLDSRGTIIYKQPRVGRFGKQFSLFKFRSMREGADKSGLLTVSEEDTRITKSGAFIRRYKLDELPQLFNVLAGEMSLVGPRPEVKKYTDMYTDEQKRILNVRPGITDMASVIYYNENSILEKQADPEKYYIEHIMPDKIKLNQVFISNPSLSNYFRILFLTVKVTLFKKD
ncbi:MAG: sugar transferase [Bacteroidetes bacterium]|nr:sugar transferase [Bacteroidota bacterium]